MKYRYEGKGKLLSLGTYPHVKLKDARIKRDEARQQLASGIGPGQARKAAKIAQRGDADRFEIVITAPEILTVLRRIENRGANDTAHRAHQNCGQIFRYAVATGRAERDPSADLRGALPPARGTHYASITDPKAISELLRAIEGYRGYAVTRSALKLAPLVFVRPGELRQAEWREFDLDAAEWRIPAERMKAKAPAHCSVIPSGRRHPARAAPADRFWSLLIPRCQNQQPADEQQHGERGAATLRLCQR